MACKGLEGLLKTQRSLLKLQTDTDLLEQTLYNNYIFKYASIIKYLYCTYNCKYQKDCDIYQKKYKE